jgi:hypothetical protein
VTGSCERNKELCAPEKVRNCVISGSTACFLTALNAVKHNWVVPASWDSRRLWQLTQTVIVLQVASSGRLSRLVQTVTVCAHGNGSLMLW